MNYYSVSFYFLIWIITTCALNVAHSPRGKEYSVFVWHVFLGMAWVVYLPLKIAFKLLLSIVR